MIYRHRNNIGIRFAALVGLYLFILIGLLPGLFSGADVPQTVTTDSIVFTGLRFEPQSVKTGSIVFTGLQFEPKSVKTGSIMFTGLGQETSFGLPESKAFLGMKEQKGADVSRGRKFEARTIEPGGKTKTIPGEAPTGFVPPLQEGIKEDSGKSTTKVARAEPDKIGAKLMLKDHNVIKSLSLKTSESFDLVFPVSNTGDTESGPFWYSITCKVLNGGPRCPVSNMIHMAPNIAAQNNYEIKLKDIAAASPGEYEVSVKLKPGVVQSDAIKRVRLKVGAAIQTITPKKGISTLEDNDKLKIKQISPIEPMQGKEQQQTPLRLRGR